MVLKIGHRGACGYEPENTLKSFAKALELGVDMVELDVHKCASGELVVIHDETLERTTNGKGLVEKTDFNTLRKFDAGKGEKIPTLKEVFDLAAHKASINIELKGPGTEYPVCVLLKEYVEAGKNAWEDFLVSSFDYDKLCNVRKFVGPKINIGLLADNINSNIEKQALDIEVFSVNVLSKCLTRAFIERMHSLDFRVMVFSVNDKEEIDKWVAWGIDGIFSDFPDII